MHDTSQLRDCCKKDKDIAPRFLGVFPADFLPHNLPDDCFFILNTDPSNKGGQHWVTGCKIGGQSYYFDSYGRQPSKWYPGWKKLDYFQRSESNFQQDNSDVCGDYCLAFLKNMASGCSYNSFLKNLDESDDLSNDQAVRAFAHKRWPRILNSTPRVVEGAYDTDNTPQRGGLALGMPREEPVDFPTPLEVAIDVGVVQINVPRRA